METPSSLLSLLKKYPKFSICGVICFVYIINIIFNAYIDAVLYLDKAQVIVKACDRDNLPLPDNLCDKNRKTLQKGIFMVTIETVSNNIWDVVPSLLTPNIFTLVAYMFFAWRIATWIGVIGNNKFKKSIKQKIFPIFTNDILESLEPSEENVKFYTPPPPYYNTYRSSRNNYIRTDE